jgi:lanosterol synthase
MFGQCMTELSYVECTASCLAALAHFRKHYPDPAGYDIETSMQRAIRYLRQCQHRDGSFAGFWGINRTYAIYHVTKGLIAAGVPTGDPLLQRAGRWLADKQRPDGGWGEHYRSCLENRYIEHPESQAVMTGWALLALLAIVPARDSSVERGIRWLIDRQRADGGWPRQAVNGVFFGAAMLDYRLYHTYFPAWALTRYARLLPN